MSTNGFHPAADDFRAARERIRPYICTTPLLRADPLERGGKRVFLKPENLQRTGSFKVRGAFNAAASFSPETKARGAVAFSSGNHGTAVALAMRELGLQERGQPYKCVVVMPEGANPVKTARVRALGAEVVFCGKTVAERQAKAEELAMQNGYGVIPSYDHKRIICGQGTLGLEIMDQWIALPSHPGPLHLVAAPVGGGGLMAGVAAALRAGYFDGRIVGVEPENANDTLQSLARGERVTIGAPVTICDGLCSTTPGKLTFPILKQFLEGVVTVSDEQVRAAVAFLLSEMKLLVEPSGAVAVAAWMCGLLDNPPHAPPRQEQAGDVVLVVSGGNVDPRLALAWLMGFEA
ncbi:MAG: threonine/serine dehydratase [Planctomycetota bacterium]